jgi:hypothetical protein
MKAICVALVSVDNRNFLIAMHLNYPRYILADVWHFGTSPSIANSTTRSPYRAYPSRKILNAYPTTSVTTARNPSLVATVVLPCWDNSARNLWPQRPTTSLAAEFAQSMVVPHPDAARSPSEATYCGCRFRGGVLQVFMAPDALAVCRSRVTSQAGGWQPTSAMIPFRRS